MDTNKEELIEEITREVLLNVMEILREKIDEVEKLRDAYMKKVSADKYFSETVLKELNNIRTMLIR